MANGTIAFDTLSTSGQITGTAKSVDTDYVVTGTNKAWIRYAQGTPSILKSLNISSVTDTSAGVFVTIFTNGFDSSHYGAATSIQTATHSNTSQLTAATASQVGGRGFNGSSATDLTHGQIFAGDLA
jgi:hypothetical protein